jgi:hypothetical protein
MKRNFLHLAAYAVALPAVSRFGRAQTVEHKGGAGHNDDPGARITAEPTTTPLAISLDRPS